MPTNTVFADIKFSSTTFNYEGEVEIRLEWLGQDLSDARIERIECLYGYRKDEGIDLTQLHAFDLSDSSIQPEDLERMIGNSIETSQRNFLF